MSATGGPEPGAIPAFPWDDALSFAFRRLGWRPAEFWAATPRELAAALGRGIPQATDRAALDRLLAAFPDHP